MPHARQEIVNVPRHSGQGFTLLEMLFVLLIVGLLTSLIAPRFGLGIDRMERTAQRQEFEDQLRQLPRRARLAARALELPKDLGLADAGDGMPALKAPADWTLRFEPPLLISAAGACSASTLTVAYPDAAEPPARYAIADLTCELAPLTP